MLSGDLAVDMRIRDWPDPDPTLYKIPNPDTSSKKKFDPDLRKTQDPDPGKNWIRIRKKSGSWSATLDF